MGLLARQERPEARAVIARQCQELGARLFEVKEYWRIDQLESFGGCYRAVVLCS